MAAMVYRALGASLCNSSCAAHTSDVGHNCKNVVAALLTTLDPTLAAQIENLAAAGRDDSGNFVTGAVRDFVERADDNLWFQLLTIMRKAEEPGLAAIHAILQWVVGECRAAP